jgi:hypothetical protein
MNCPNCVLNHAGVVRLAPRPARKGLAFPLATMECPCCLALYNKQNKLVRWPLGHNNK